jgi:hypothetical protein
VPEVGVMLVTHDTVSVNTTAVHVSGVVCEGDHVSTDNTGVGDLILSGDHESDSIHFAENTDPVVRWTAARCLSVDGFVRGTVIIHTRKLCVLVRTPDALLYQPPNSRNLLTVKTNAPTELKAFYGVAPVKLQPLAPAAVRTLSLNQLLAQRAPVELQPKANSVTLYRADKVQASRAIAPTELRQIETMRTRIPPDLKAITRP